MAISDGPWYFFKSLVIFKQIDGLQNPSDVLFDEITLWIQCHNLPVTFMHPYILRSIGDTLGKIEDIDLGEGATVYEDSPE